MLIMQRSGALLARACLALLVCLIAGLLVAGVALPVVGGTGLIARKGIETFDDSKDLDAVLERLVNLRLGQRSRILDVDGQLLAEVQTAEDRTLASIDAVPAVMVHALLAIEDTRFYQHHGVDLKGVVRAAVKNQRSGQVQQGASTLTQQYVKNALLAIAETPEEQKAAVEQTPGRKLREARLALEMERRFSKNEILERYLNIAYFGNGSYGVRTAAQFYFKVAVERLTLAQAALLAGLVQSPSRWDPVRHYDAALSRRNVVLAKMAEVFPCDPTGASNPAVALPTDQAAVAAPVCYSETAPEAALQPITLNIRKSPGAVSSVAPYFLDYVQTYLLEDSTVLGKTKEEREAAYFRGGLTIRTTLDRKVQAAAQEALASTDIKDQEPSTAIVVIEPGTGAIKAMAVNTTAKGDRSLNLATGGQFGMQAGSTFKVFVLAAALEQGMPLGTSFNSPQEYTSPVFEKSKGVPYKVGNAADSESGVFNLLTGTWDSVNTFYLQLEEKTGIKPAVDIARKMMGPKPARPISKAVDIQPSFVLGTTATSVLDVANAYATIAARGIACQSTAVAEVYNPRRERFKLATPNCSRVLTEKVADTLAFILQGVIDGDHPRTGFRASLGDRPAAGKTGTAQEYRSAFFAGFTPDYAAAVWMGNSLAPTRNPLLNVEGVEDDFEKVFGGTFPALIWKKTMLAIEQGKPVRAFIDPPPDVFVGTEIEMPDLGGKTVEEAQAALTKLALSAIIAPVPLPSLYPAGKVAFTNPAKGRKVAIGSSVIVYLSNGLPPPPPPCPSTPPAGSSAPAPGATVVPCTPAPCVATPTVPCPSAPAGSSPPASTPPPNPPGKPPKGSKPPPQPTPVAADKPANVPSGAP